MSTILNFIRFFIMGWWQWLIYMFFAFICSITVVLLPLAKSFREIAKLLLMPFGKEIVRNKDMGTYHKSFGLIFNIIWFPIGLILAIFYFISGVLICFTIIGIPAGIVMIKLSKIIILPIGVKVLTKKEYIQEMLKEELKKQGVQNNNNVTIDNSKNQIIEENNKLFTNTDNILVSDNIDNIVKKNGIIGVIIFSILFLLLLILVYVISKYIILLTLIFIFSIFSFGIYLIIKLDILDFIVKKFNINNIVFTNFIQKINLNFVLLILLSITLFLGYLNVIISISRHTSFFEIFIISNLIQIHFIILFVITFIKLGKIKGVSKEFNKLKQFDFFNR